MKAHLHLEMKFADRFRVQHFIDSHVWHFARTMPDIPHWYCLLKDNGDTEEFRWFAAFTREHSEPGQFCGRTYHYFYWEGFKYWWMDHSPEECDLINRDVIDGEIPIVFPHYSLILTGSLERVLDLFRQYNVPIQPSNFYADKGYVFMVRAGYDNDAEFLEALKNSGEVMGVSSMYGQGIEGYIAFCKDSIVPVEIGFDL